MSAAVLSRNEMPKSTKRILVMEDDRSIQRMLARCLTKFNFKYELSDEGNSAIQKYLEGFNNKTPFDVVLMDLNNHIGLNGEETIQKLLHIDPNVKAIATSSNFDNYIIDHYEQYGFVDILPKPYTINDLFKVLTHVLQN
jgi:CheY-like chemotaxis protein